MMNSNPHYGHISDGIDQLNIMLQKGLDVSPFQAMQLGLASQAAMAAAFEQRTANLIAYAAHNPDVLAEGIDVDIRERLGMDPLTVDAPSLIRDEPWQSAKVFNPDQRCGKPLMDGRNEIRCWLKAHHEEECR